MISNFLSNDLSYAIAMTLIHSIWQIGLIAVILGVTLRIVEKSPASHKYFMSLGALSLSMVISLLTFSLYYMDSSSTLIFSPQFSSLQQASMIAAEANGFSFTLDFADKYVIVIVNAWLIGSLLFLARFTGAYLFIKQLIRQSHLDNPVLLNVLKNLKKKYAIHRSVIIKESSRITTPLVMGYMKPVILFPIGLANQLSTQEVEAILAHELAHIKRHDFIFNLLQSFAEIIYYYHPAMWYISSRMRFERENCCDDIAIDMTGNSVSYAKTLVKLQDIKHTSMAPALAFSGNQSQFSQRILRILNLPVNASNMRQRILAFLLIFSTVFAFAKSVNHTPNIETETSPLDVYIIEDCPQESDEITYFLDTIPERKSFHIKKKTDEEELELEMENGEITKLKINGDEIPEENYDDYDNIILELSPNEEHDIITFFPDCDKGTGNIFFRDKDFGRTIKIDSILDKLKNEDFSFGEEDGQTIYFDTNQFNEDWIDAYTDKLKSLNIGKHMNDQNSVVIKLDSILELFPGKISSHPIVIDDHEIIIGGGDFNFKLHDDAEHDIIIKEHFNDALKNYFHSEKNYDIYRNHLKDNVQRELFEYKDHDQSIFDRDDVIVFGNKPQNVSDILTLALLKDQLIEPRTKYKLELSGKHLKINGEKQPSNIWKKYKNIYEQHTGIELTKKSKIEIETSAKDNREAYIRKLI